MPSEVEARIIELRRDHPGWGAFRFLSAAERAPPAVRGMADVWLAQVRVHQGRLLPVDSWEGTMAWHQRHRLGVLRARLALADGHAERAFELGSAVAADAAARGATRYEQLARAVVGLSDPAMPSERLALVVDGLSRCAVLDGWPLVAALAAARRSDPWRAQAERLASMVVAGAGDNGDVARRFVAGLLRT